MPFAVAGLAAGLALFSALTFWLTRAATRLWHLDGVARLFAFAACWLLGEGLRTWLFTGFPWNLLGTVWAFPAAPLHDRKRQRLNSSHYCATCMTASA